MLPFGSIRADGWLLERLRRDARGIVGNLDELCDQVSPDIYTSGRVDSDRPGGWWNGESTGNWLDGLVRLSHVLPDALLDEKVATWIDHLLQSQDDDGYLGVYLPELRWRTDGPSGELFCSSRILSALLVHHQATGREDVLEAIVRAASLIVDNCDPGEGGNYFSSEGRVDGGRAHGLLLVEQMLAVAELTGQDRFVEFARRCYEDFSFSDRRSDFEWAYEDCKLPHLLDPDRPFMGHGPHTVEHLRIPLLLHQWTGDARYLAAFEAGVVKLERCLGLSGACKSDEWIGMRGFSGIAIPLIPESGYEYCTTTELALTLQAALAITGDARFGDMAERLLFNAAEAARGADGRSIAYVAADNQHRAATDAGPRWKYSPTHADVAVCCAPNAGRAAPSHVANMLMRSADDGMAIALYGPARATLEVQGQGVGIVQRTAYPYSDEVTVEVELDAAARFPLWLRVPAWAEAMHVTIGNDSVPFEDRGGFRRLDRLWHPGDTVTIQFETSVRPVHALDATVAVERGPLVFALPIEGVTAVAKPYAVEGFNDVDTEPAAGARWDYTLLLGTDGGLAHATVEWATADGHPLVDPPISITLPFLDSPGHLHFGTTVTRLRLVPIAATTLRRTSFPAVPTLTPAALGLGATTETASGLAGT